MSPPPCYSDLGKKARDIFDKDFKIGICNFEVKSKTSTGTEVKITGTHDHAKNYFDNLFEYRSKITCGVYNKIKVDSKWNMTDEIEVSDRLIRNLKQTAITTVKADDASKSFTFKNCHVSSYTHLNADFQFKESCCPKTVASLVAGPMCTNLPFFVGATTTLESRARVPSNAAASLFHNHKDMQFCMTVDKDKNVDFSAFHATSLVDLAVKIGYNLEAKSLKSGVGFLYKPTHNVFVKGKIDNDVNIGLAYGVKITEGMNLIFSTLIDGKKPNEPHKMGFTIEAVV